MTLSPQFSVFGAIFCGDENKKYSLEMEDIPRRLVGSVTRDMSIVGSGSLT